MCITVVALNSWLAGFFFKMDISRILNLISPAVVITDQEYPVRPAFSLLTKLLDDFTSKVPSSSFSNPSSISFTEIETYIKKYQDPRQADTIMRVQQELDETKIVLVCDP